MKDKIIIKGIEIYGYHGVLAEEKILGQKFIIDIEMTKSLLKPGISDNVEDTVSYAAVYKDIEEVATTNKFDLIETLAERISNKVLENYEIDSVLVRIKKPQAPIAGAFKYVAVEILRQKDA